MHKEVDWWKDNPKRYNITMYIDPNSRGQYTVTSGNDICINWVENHCPSAYVSEPQSYWPYYEIWFESLEEETKFLDHFSSTIQQNSEYFFIMYDGKYQRTSLNTKDLVGQYGQNTTSMVEYVVKNEDVSELLSNAPKGSELWVYYAIGALSGSAGLCLIDPINRILYKMKAYLRS